MRAHEDDRGWSRPRILTTMPWIIPAETSSSMPSSDDAIRWYDAHASDLAPRYEGLRPEEIHGWLADLLPDAPGLVLDVEPARGATRHGSPRRASRSSPSKPSTGMRREAERLHPSPGIRWIDDRLPSLSTTLRLGIDADIVFLNAVWMHLTETDRRRSFRKLVSLTKSGGVIAISLRIGAPDAERGLHVVSVAEIESLAPTTVLSLLGPCMWKTSSGAATFRGPVSPFVCRMTARTRFPFFATSFSTMTRRRLTSSACCEPCAAPPTPQPVLPAKLARNASPCRWASSPSTGSRFIFGCCRTTCHRARLIAYEGSPSALWGRRPTGSSLEVSP